MPTKAEKLTEEVAEFVATIDLNTLNPENVNDEITMLVINKFGLSISRGYAEAGKARATLSIGASGRGFKAAVEDLILESLEGGLDLSKATLREFVEENRTKGEVGSKERKADVKAYTSYAVGICKFAKSAYRLGVEAAQAAAPAPSAPVAKVAKAAKARKRS